MFKLQRKCHIENHRKYNTNKYKENKTMCLLSSQSQLNAHKGPHNNCWYSHSYAPKSFKTKETKEQQSNKKKWKQIKATKNEVLQEFHKAHMTYLI